MNRICFYIFILILVLFSCSTILEASYIDNGNGTITDTSTSLIWQQATVPIWQLATAPNRLNWDDAVAYCESLTLGGYSDWRVPTLNELRSIIDTNYWPTINHTYFPGTAVGYYWTSTLMQDRNFVYIMNFIDGDDSTSHKDSEWYLRAVRGEQSSVGPVGSLRVVIEADSEESEKIDMHWRRIGTGAWIWNGHTETDVPVGTHTIEFKVVSGYSKPANQSAIISDGRYTTVTGTYTLLQPNYVDNGDGTVTDKSTGLIWQQGAPKDPIYLSEAVTYCEGLDLGGYSDWRLPNINELRSLVRRSYKPTIDPDYFPDTLTLYPYWSSTTYGLSTNEAWGVYFSYGSITNVQNLNIGGQTYPARAYVRAVRSVFIADIRANGSDGPISVSPGNAVSISVNLVSADREGEVADWWIAVKTPFDPPGDWYTYGDSHGWQTGIHSFAQTGLLDLSAFEVLNMALPTGKYTFYIAFDDPDGAATGPWWGIDSVVVDVH